LDGAIFSHLAAPFWGTGLTAELSLHCKLVESLKSGLGQLMACRSLLIAVLLLVSADRALANWWIVRASDETCLVVDIEPTGNDKGVTKLGKDSYQTREQAEADVKQLCKESKSQSTSTPGNAE
jgi:hypothetical protein